ncbi:MAG: hypothetical protein FH748_13840 [Balneolaceae bacterium]|nr:hypothetical protein [Balneolaceae bacterium]
MNIYFWNINNSIQSFNLAKDIVSQENESIFIVSEFWDIYDQINLPDSFGFVNDDIHKRVGIITNNNFRVNFEESKKYYLITSLVFNSIKIIICSVHFLAKNKDPDVQKRIVEKTINEINESLNSYDSNNKIIIGDFNIEPFDDSMLNIYNFNSVSSIEHRSKLYKTYQDVDYDIYYNPFFSYHGDLSAGPPGTYFYEKETQTQPWYIFDQALINSKFLNNIDTKECNVLEKLNGIGLTKKSGRPKTDYSDHLPIKIKIN